MSVSGIQEAEGLAEMILLAESPGVKQKERLRKAMIFVPQSFVHVIHL